MRALWLLAALPLCSCSEDSEPPLPAGALKLNRDGMLRAGQVDIPEPTRLLRARRAEGPVSVEIDPEASTASVAQLLSRAVDADLVTLEITGSARIVCRLAPRPERPPSVRPDVPPPPSPDVSRAVGELQLTARPNRSELVIRITRPAASADEQRLRDAVVGLIAEIRTNTVTLVIEAPRAAAWSRIASVLATATSAIGERLVRHELVALP